MKKIVFAVFLVLMAIGGAYGAELKIGYVDLNRALNESEEGKKAVRALEDIVKSRQALIDGKRREIGKLEEDMSKQSSVLNQEALREKKKEHRKMSRELDRLVKDSEEEVEERRADFMDRIVRELTELTRKMGEEEGYAVVFDKVQGGVIYITEKYDITEKLIKRFNEIKVKK
ncbi:MAG: OmpH family outer membrane protein [Nitrospiraceae bacterium]|nr:MAG: OmpH family outer membrane protein [Nitrospiraceae bacterium]